MDVLTNQIFYLKSISVGVTAMLLRLVVMAGSRPLWRIRKAHVEHLFSGSLSPRMVTNPTTKLWRIKDNMVNRYEQKQMWDQ